MHRILLLAMFLLAAFTLTAQDIFRVITDGPPTVDSTLTDSTYRISFNIFSDITANGVNYFASGIMPGHYLFTGSGRQYVIQSVTPDGPFAATADILEFDTEFLNTEGPPNTQAMIFRRPDTEKLPQVPFGTTAAGALVQAAVDTYNALVVSDGAVFNNAYNVASDFDTTRIYLPAHGYDTTDYQGSVIPVKPGYALASSVNIDSVQIGYVIDTPHPDSIDFVVSGRITRPAHGLAVGKVYYLTDVAGAYDTIRGTVESAALLPTDVNTIELLEQGADASFTIPRVVVLGAFITTYGGDPRSPSDSVMQVIAELFTTVGRLKPGSVLVTQSVSATANPTHQNATSEPSTPSNAWFWDGNLVTRVSYATTSFNLQDTVYGVLQNIPLTPVVGDPPTSSQVVDWINTNFASGVQVRNGDKLYYVGNGTDSNPDYMWEVLDDATAFGGLVKQTKSEGFGIVEMDTLQTSDPGSTRSPWRYSRADSTLYRWNYVTSAWESVVESFGIETLANTTAGFTMQPNDFTLTQNLPNGATVSYRYGTSGEIGVRYEGSGGGINYRDYFQNIGNVFGSHFRVLETTDTDNASLIHETIEIAQLGRLIYRTSTNLHGDGAEIVIGEENATNSTLDNVSLMATGEIYRLISEFDTLYFPKTTPTGGLGLWSNLSTGGFNFIKLGSGLSIAGDTLVATGGGSFTFDVSDGGAQVETVASSNEIAFTGATVSKGGGIITVDIPAGTDDQAIDTLTFDGTNLSASLEGDGEAAQTVDLSSLQEPTDGDKTDITVSASGATWAIDDNTVGDAELASTAVTAGLYTNGLSVNVNEDGRIEGISFSAVAMTGLASAVQDSITIGRAAVFNDAPAGSTQTIFINNKSVGIFQIDYTGASSPLTLTVNNPVDGGVYTFHHRNVTSQDVVYPAAFYNADGTSLGTVTYTADDFLTCYYDGTNYYCK